MGKKDVKGKKAGRPQARKNPWWLFVAIGVGVIGLVVSLVSFAGGGGSPTGGATQNSGPLAQYASLPIWLSRAPFSTQEAYAYAAQHPETLNYVPCYCGCGLHSGHRNNRECFVSSGTGANVAWDRHGADCAMCIDIAMMTKKMLAQGKTLAQARQAVVEKYSSIGPATNTPPVPQG
ncbi:MAG: hypothetical protein HY671_04140 [Chloroflexi bacterium]|nr:hypothetical protein [Chloroflexota bacterium]